MYRWYYEAVVCYAYLFDVGNTEVSPRDNFAASAWWTRGWIIDEDMTLAKVPHL